MGHYVHTMDKCVANALSYIRSRQELIDCVRDFSEPTGFMYSNNPLIVEIVNAVDEDGHSGASFSICMRRCQAALLAEQLPQ